MSINKLHQSIYRLFTFPNFCPQIVIDLEKQIIKESIDRLSQQEIKQVFESWPDFLSTKTKKQEVEDRLTTLFLNVNNP